MAETVLKKQLRTWQRRRADERLFRALCQLHGLNSRQISLLRELATRAQLVRAAEAFLRPQLFRTQSAPEGHSTSELTALFNQIFASKRSPSRPAALLSSQPRSWRRPSWPRLWGKSKSIPSNPPPDAVPSPSRPDPDPPVSEDESPSAEAKLPRRGHGPAPQISQPPIPTIDYTSFQDPSGAPPSLQE